MVVFNLEDTLLMLERTSSSAGNLRAVDSNFLGKRGFGPLLRTLEMLGKGIL
jgi:hypothetical protein